MRLLLPTLLLVVAGCQPAPDRAPCADFDCSGHGTCALVTNVPTCLCQSGYTPSASGWLCLPATDASLCAGVTCSGHGTCASVQGQARCVCQPGFVLGVNGLTCTDPCDGVSCGGGGTCALDAANAPICRCGPGTVLAPDGLSCAAALPDSVLTYALLWDDYPGWQLGTLALDMSGQAAGTLVETLTYGLHFDYGGRGLSRATRATFTLDKTGGGVTALEFDEQFTQGTVSRRRYGQATLGPAGGAAVFQRQGQLATVPLAYAGGGAPPLPMLGAFEYPGWALGSFSPTFYTLALKRYDTAKKGEQSIDVLWPEAGIVSRVRIAAATSYTDGKPVLHFPDYSITVTYKDGLPQLIHLDEEQVGWSLYSGTPVDPNLADRPAAKPFVPPPLPTDLTEAAASFSSADGTSLGGTLTRPAAPVGPVPAVLLVGDMLGADRDHPYLRLPATPLYRHLAAHLAHAGFASLRYDPRGRGASQGTVAQYTLPTLIKDAVAAFDHLAAAAGIDQTKIFVLSLGPGAAVAIPLVTQKPARGYLALAPLVADVPKAIAFADTAHLKASGFSQKFLDQQTKQTMDTLQTIKDNTFGKSEYRGLPVALWKELLAYSGASALAAFPGPVLVARGDQDLETPPEQLQAAQDAATKLGKKNLTLKTLPGLCYVLAAAKSAELLESVVLPLTVESNGLAALTTWLKQN